MYDVWCFWPNDTDFGTYCYQIGHSNIFQLSAGRLWIKSGRESVGGIRFCTDTTPLIFKASDFLINSHRQCFFGSQVDQIEPVWFLIIPTRELNSNSNFIACGVYSGIVCVLCVLISISRGNIFIENQNLIITIKIRTIR